MPSQLVNIALNALRIITNIGDLFSIKAWGQGAIDYINAIAAMQNDVVNTWLWQGVRQTKFWDANIHPNAATMRADVLAAFGDTSAALNHTVDVIIPNSVKDGTHKIWSGVGGTRGQIRQLITEESATAQEVAHLHTWINTQVNPYINGYKKFVINFDKYWGPALQTLIDWIAAPALLSAKLTPSITPDVVAQLGAHGSKTTVNRLWHILLAAAPRVEKAIDQAAVNVLNAGSYPQP